MKYTPKGHCGTFTTSAELKEEFQRIREKTLLAHVHLLQILRDEDVESDFVRARDLYESHYRLIKNLIFDYNGICDKAYKLRSLCSSDVAYANATKDSMRLYWKSIRELYNSILDLWSYSPFVLTLPEFDSQVIWGPKLPCDFIYRIRDAVTGKVLRR